MKRPCFHCVALFVVLLIGSMVSASNWTGQGSEMYWDIGQNWSNGAAPAASDTQNVVNVLADDGITELYPIVDTLEGATDVCANLYIGTTVDGTLGDGSLDMVGGHLALSGNAHLGSQAGSAGLMNMEDGILEVDGQFNVGQFGDGHLRMAGGHIIAHGTWMHIPNAGNSTGRVDLFGGTLETTATFITRSVARSLVDLSGGKIVVPTDNAGNLAGYIADGRIIAYGGRGTVNSEVVDSNTVLTGTADPAVMAKAWHESPADGEILFDLSPTLTWVAGEDATSHQVYLGTDPDALALLAAEPNQGALSVDFYAKLEGLVPGTTYYWRVDEMAADTGVSAGEVWSFVTVPPETSRTVSPADGSNTDEITGVMLDWEPGVNAASFNVYFAAGTDDLALVSEAQAQPNYAVPGILVPGQTYRWRIDTSNGTDMFGGLAVSFKAGDPPATAAWTDADLNDSLWTTPGNWAQNTVPGIGTNAQLHNDYPTAVVDATTTAYCSELQLGWNIADVDCQLNVEGGSLTIEGELLLCRFLDSMATLHISDGVVNCGFLRGWHGDMWVIQSGGEFNCAGNLEIPRSYASDTGTVGVYKLDGGVCRAGDLVLNSNSNVKSELAISKGKLILDGDKRSKVNGYIAAGLVTAYDGLETASISMAYDAQADETTVIACEKVWQADFNADCVVDEKDRALVVTALGDTTMAVAVWDFDMSTDPVGTDFWNVFVRIKNGVLQGDYVMDQKLGVMKLPGGNFTLDHQQKDNVSGAFDMDLHMVAKSTSLAPIRVWLPIESSATPGTYALPHTALYRDGTTQTVEISNGAYWWVGDYAPLVLTGFSADALVDITIQCDQETDSLVYTVTDGTKTETGTWNYTSSGGGGDGGDWVLLTDAGGTGVVDHLTVKIHGTNWNSPYDINLDGVVDQVDLDVLEAEMAN